MSTKFPRPRRYLVGRVARCNDAEVTASREPIELLVVANDEFARRLRLVGPDGWRRPTPCSERDVRALVNHVIGGNVRYQLLLSGAPTERDVVTFLLTYTAGLDLGPEQRAFAPAATGGPRNASPQHQLLHRLGRHPNITEEVK